MVNVLLVSPAGVRGGVGTVIYTLANGLRARGAGVTVLSLSDGELLTDLRRAGLECVLHPVSSKFALGDMARAARPVLTGRFDVVHTHGPRAMFALNPPARLARVPAVVTTIHGVSSVFAQELGLWRHRLHQTLERAIARTCTDGLIVWAASMIDDVERRGFRRSMVHHIDNPVDTARFRPLPAAGRDAARRRAGLAPGERGIGIVGRLVELKGHAVLLDAFALTRAARPEASDTTPAIPTSPVFASSPALAPSPALVSTPTLESSPALVSSSTLTSSPAATTASIATAAPPDTRGRLRLIIAGDGPARASLEARARALGIETAVTFLGDLPDPEQVMNACEIVAYPSTHGIIGLTALEAMACGAALIASELPGTTEFVRDDQTALLVPPSDSAALSRALLALLDSPATLDRLRRAGRDMVADRFNPDLFVDRHLDLYARLARNARRARSI